MLSCQIGTFTILILSLLKAFDDAIADIESIQED